MVNKDTLRRVYLEKRLFLTVEEVQKRSKSIADQAIRMIKSKGYKNVHIFLAMEAKNEIKTQLIIDVFQGSEVRFIVPKTKAGGVLEHYWLDHCQLKQNKWGIPEPENGVKANLDEIEAVLVPMIVGDKHGHRIGYGKGFYDRFLAEIPKTPKVGLSLQPLLDKIDYVDTNDVALDRIIHA